MTKTRWKYFITIVFISVLTMYFFYQYTHISIWGFSFKKSELKDIIVLVHSNETLFISIIDDHETVLEIANLLSNSEKQSKVTHQNFPPEETPEKYIKVEIRTNDDTVYGGRLWINGSTHVQDSNGYYWRIDYLKLSHLLDEAIPMAEIEK
jgi:hypothetical protein